jgi:hypothetical protein
MEEWDRIAWLCAHIPRFGSARKTLDDFHPIRGRNKTVNMGQLLAWGEEQKQRLPKYESEEDIERRWQAYLKEQENGRR